MSIRPNEFYGRFRRIWENIPVSEDRAARAAADFLNALAGEGHDGSLPEPFRGAVEVLHRELSGNSCSRPLKEFFQILSSPKSPDGEDAVSRALWNAFFPEALYLSDSIEEQIERLRTKRIVDITSLAREPIGDAANEIIFTSNVLLSPPVGPPHSSLSEDAARIVEQAAGCRQENQLYWYDHPIPLGIPAEQDEALYGLGGLARTLAFEKERGTASPDSRLTVLLSISVTHAGLRSLAKPWLKTQLESLPPGILDGLDIYAFTEEDSRKILSILKPWCSELESLAQTFGVDGEYGRHYSFLKALPAVWALLIDPRKRATFKIDLDQIFPEEQLVSESGGSAFEHFSTPLWGALARDSQGRAVELGLLAGALVNEKDISRGLFTPDIPWPPGRPEGEDAFFFKQRPMAVSTRAEMMTRYTPDCPHGIDGLKRALHRIHVTGGTSGIRLDALRRHRPFTPTFVGRAEDQGYILSVLFGKDDGPLLRYAHASGLIMRHDREAFAGAAIQAGKNGSYVGDLIRIFVFSAYAQILYGGTDAVKEETDPFTGCFITPMPATLALIRLALKLLAMPPGGQKEDLLQLAGRRLKPWIASKDREAGNLAETWGLECRAWDAYYDALDSLDDDLARRDETASSAHRAFETLGEECRIFP